MIRKNILWFALPISYLCLFALTGCSKISENPVDNNVTDIPDSSSIDITSSVDINRISVYPDEEYQVIEGFGASAAWWAQDVGGWKSVRDEIMELLYGKSGIGLNIYRYNLGAGTSDGRKKGTYNDGWRKTRSFISDDGSIDYTLDENAVWCMKKAVELGADNVVFFSNSAPDTMTKNGKAQGDVLSSGEKAKTNLSAEKYLDFANYALNAVTHFRNEGIPVTAISPINEPQWDWTGGQEGCHFELNEMIALYKVFHEEMQNRSLADSLELSMLEYGQWYGTGLIECINALTSDEILKNCFHTIDAHSYWTTATDKSGINQWLNKNHSDLKRRVTEWTEMTNGRDVTMDSALIMANTVFDDLTILSATSWSYWIAVSCYDYRDGLIYVNTANRTYETTKRLYAFGNFTRFIEKDSVRVASKSSNSNLRSTAFTSDTSMTVVLINNDTEPMHIQLDTRGNIKYNNMSVYVTDNEHNLESIYSDVEVSNTVILPAQSVCTIILDL